MFKKQIIKTALILKNQLDPQTWIKVDWAIQSVNGEKRMKKNIPLCLTKCTLHLLMLDVSLDSAPTLCHSIKREKGVSSLYY